MEWAVDLIVLLFLFTYCIIPYFNEAEKAEIVKDEFVRFIKALVK